MNNSRFRQKAPRAMAKLLIESAHALCTIITPDYLPYALAVRTSLDLLQCDWPLHVLVTGPCNVTWPRVHLWSVPHLSELNPTAKAIVDKYASETDRLRWCLKAVFLATLVETKSADSVVYCDSDVCFFQHPKPIFDELATGGTVLTPHWRPPTPVPSARNFRLNFLDGLFNAGCVGVNSRGLDAMAWWADACLHACEKNHAEGLFDDQRYLDLLPVYFPETRILRRFGFNLADWNRHLREPGGDGSRLVPDKEAVSLVHFTKNTIRHIEGGRDPVLEPYLERYKQILTRLNQRVAAVV